MCNKPSGLLIYLLLSLLAPFANAGDKRQAYAGLAGFGEESGGRFGAEAWFYHFGDYWGLRTGLSYYEVDLEQADIDTGNDDQALVDDGFAGISLAGSLHLNTIVSPYLALGLFVGEREDCNKTSGVSSNTSDQERDCFNDYAAAFYPELGLQLKLPQFYLALFAREVADSENNFAKFRVYGASLAFAF